MLVKLKQKLQLLLCDMVISNVDKKDHLLDLLLFIQKYIKY